MPWPPNPGFDDIASNFTVNDHLDGGFDDADCNTGTGEGKLRFLCIESHLGYNDPIVYPSQPGAAHLHQFFGNTLTNAYSDYSSLRTTGSGTCQGGPINRTAYWYPAMIRPQNNKVVKPSYVEMYYVAESTALAHDNYTPTSGPYSHVT
jgi:hypothetical protein